jgi:hypothetical protein
MRSAMAGEQRLKCTEIGQLHDYSGERKLVLLAIESVIASEPRLRSACVLGHGAVPVSVPVLRFIS